MVTDGHGVLVIGIQPRFYADLVVDLYDDVNFHVTVQEIARDKPKVRPRNQLSIDKNLFLAKVTEMGMYYYTNKLLSTTSQALRS